MQELVPIKGDKHEKVPSSPGFSPHLWFVGLVWREVVTVEPIACVNLLR